MLKNQSLVSIKSVNFENVVVAGDFHFPFQSQACATLFLYFIKWMQPKIIVLNGDIIDFYPLSKFDSDPNRKLTLQLEIDETYAFLCQIREICPNAIIYYLEGNHEYRLQRWLWSHPEVASLRTLAFAELLYLQGLKIEFVPYEEAIELYDLTIHHGTKVSSIGGGTGRAMIDMWGSSGISNHVHRFNTVSKTNHRQDFFWHENGCMCKRPSWIKGPSPNWQQGFSVLRSDSEHGHVDLVPVKIVKEKISYNDKIFVYNGHIPKTL